MTFAKPKMFSISMPSAVSDAVRSLLSARDVQDSAPIAKPQAAGPQIDAFHQDRSRYGQMLETELDRQTLTAIEREDTDMINRVRSALYAD